MENENQELVELQERLKTKEDIYKHFLILDTPTNNLDNNPKLQKSFIAMAWAFENNFGGSVPKKRFDILHYNKIIDNLF